jgi:hypothetical protein
MNRWAVRSLPVCLVALLVCRSWAQGGAVVVSESLDGQDSKDLQAFRARVAAANPNMDVISVEGKVEAQLAPRPVPQTPKIAIFTRNQSPRKGLSEEVDGLRDLVAAELAGQDMIVLDSQEIAGGFHRYKVTTEEERAGLVDGVFTGGSAVRVAQMIGADYLLLVSLNSADKRTRSVGGSSITTYQTVMAVKVLEAGAGSSVYGKVVDEKYPSHDASGSGDDDSFFHNLFMESAKTISQSVAESSPKWRRPAAPDATAVAFSVSTTVDELIQGLELGARAANDVLDELRRVVGGATVEVDGAVVGSSPGTFKVSPGLHQVRVTRAWMQPWQQTVNIQEGMQLKVALELSADGIAKFTTVEGFKAAAAVSYAEAAYRKGIKINFDTAGWQSVTLGKQGTEISVDKTEVHQDGAVNQVVPVNR